MRSARIFAGGVPTEPEIKRLVEKYGVPVEGTMIAYTEVEEVTGVTYRTNRWNAVTTRWRAQLLRDHNCAIGTEEKHFKVLTPDERVARGREKGASAIKGLRRASHLVDTTDKERLSAEMRAEAEHFSRCASALLLAARSEAKRFQPQLPD